MPKTFQKEFRTEGCTARIRRRKCSQKSMTYDIRYRRNGFNISATDKNLEIAKQRFIELLKTAKKKVYSGVPTNFHEFTVYYFETFRKRKISPYTYRDNFNKYYNHIQPF